MNIILTPPFSLFFIFSLLIYYNLYFCPNSRIIIPKLPGNCSKITILIKGKGTHLFKVRGH
ncbi:MAG: hypothetical protein C4554_07900 [Dethiobacter sp.]|nr:MAG: hypothetical protein C4554_07900 [Dethiobacter sp.]